MAFPHELPDLGYAYDALEPHIDARTMEIHHSKHHAGYTKNLNAALESHPDFQGTRRSSSSAASTPSRDSLRGAVRNNGGGFHNHALFWEILKPGGASTPGGDLGSAIDQAFGSFDALKEQVSGAAAGRFGSGWGWLVVDPFGHLRVTSTPNQDSPLIEGSTPILGVDVWEHAYYLKYQNRRPDYLAAFWNVVNWDVVAEKYARARGGWIAGT
jgi:superoxide dismutase, Fe-Mn family